MFERAMYRHRRNEFHCLKPKYEFHYRFLDSDLRSENDNLGQK